MAGGSSSPFSGVPISLRTRPNSSTGPSQARPPPVLLVARVRSPSGALTRATRSTGGGRACEGPVEEFGRVRKDIGTPENGDDEPPAITFGGSDYGVTCGERVAGLDADRSGILPEQLVEIVHSGAVPTWLVAASAHDEGEVWFLEKQIAEHRDVVGG